MQGRAWVWGACGLSVMLLQKGPEQFYFEAALAAA